MIKRGRLFLAIAVVCMLVSLIIPCVNAEIFDVGTKVAESDFPEKDRWYYFDSGSMVQTRAEYINYTTSIFDGNESTGIDHYFGSDPNYGYMDIYIDFPYPLNVSNITIKSVFNGNSTRGYFKVYFGVKSTGISWEINQNKTIQINGSVRGVHLQLNSNSTNHFYFRDVIINYTPSPSDLTDVIAALDILINTVNSLQNQINNLNQQIDQMNNTINSLNQSQLQILENLTTLQSNYNQMNNSLISLFNEIENLNITTNENITSLQNDLNSINMNINDIYRSLDDLTTNVTELTVLEDLISQTTQEIQYLDENITEIRNTLPSEYDDTTVTTRIFQLESENAALNNDIHNLTEKIENLENEMDEPEDFIPLGAFVMGILGILIAIIAVALATRKREPEKPSEAKDEAEEAKTSEEDENKISKEDPDS
jgi:predicted nuclease with TOPRIM domain